MPIPYEYSSEYCSVAAALEEQGAYELYKWPTYLCWNHVPYQVHPARTKASFIHCNPLASSSVLMPPQG